MRRIAIATLLLSSAFFFAFSGGAQQPAAAPARVADESLPSADQVLDKYLQAAGGRAAWEKVTSRVSKGSIELSGLNLKGIVEIFEKAPNKSMSIVTIPGIGDFRQSFDGTSGWTDDPQQGLRDTTGPALADAKREAEFYLPLKWHELYPKLQVTGLTKIDDANAYTVQATPQDGDPQTFYFDQKTGLLLREAGVQSTPDGKQQVQLDFQNYSETDGVKLPSTIHQTTPDSSFTITINEIHQNVPIPDAQFAKPAKAPPAAPSGT